MVQKPFLNAFHLSFIPLSQKKNPVNRPLPSYKWYKKVLQINHGIILPAKWSPLFTLKPQISFLQGPKYDDLIVSFTTEQSIIPLITIIIIYFLIHWDLFGFKTPKKIWIISRSVWVLSQDWGWLQRSGSF